MRPAPRWGRPDARYEGSTRSLALGQAGERVSEVWVRPGSAPPAGRGADSWVGRRYRAPSRPATPIERFGQYVREGRCRRE